jgi:hypothetical protein
MSKNDAPAFVETSTARPFDRPVTEPGLRS